MRTLLTKAAFGFATVLASTLPAAAENSLPATRGIEAEIVDPANPEAAAVSRTGAAAINWLGARLIYEINSALAKGGAEAAVAICHLKTISASAQPVPGMPSIKAVKRTSLRLLNAANAPDAADLLVLEHVDRQIRAGDPPQDLVVQRITSPDGSVEWRVYRPLAVLPNCLACHGDPAAHSPALQTLLREKAPANVAIGYSAGEWRGLLRVTVAPPAAK